MSIKVTESLLLISAGDMSGNITSDAIDLGNRTKVGFHVTAPSATHVGTIYFQQFNGLDDTPTSHSTTVSAADGSAVDEFVNLEIYSQYVRVFYDYTSGTGALTVKACVKD